MKYLILFLLSTVIQYDSIAAEVDDGKFEPLPHNPIDFIPLEVGNGWTYIHYYLKFQGIRLGKTSRCRTIRSSI